MSLDGRPVNRAENQNAFLRYVTPGYFATLGIPLKVGRDIDDGRYAGSAGGRRSSANRSSPASCRMRRRHRRSATTSRSRCRIASSSASPATCGCAASSGRRSRRSTCRSGRSPTATSSAISRARCSCARRRRRRRSRAPVRAIIQRDRSDAAGDRRRHDDRRRRTRHRVAIGAGARARRRSRSIAFVLAGIGIHGLLSFSVSQRAQEIGVRMALGAQSGDILRMIVRRSVLLALAGVISRRRAGVCRRPEHGSAAGRRQAGRRCRRCWPPSALSVLMTLVGSVMPTLRALRVDPITALRAE